LKNKQLVVIQHVEREGPGLFADVAKERGFSIKLVSLCKGDKLISPNRSQVYLFLGGPMGISDLGNDNYPWLSKEVKLIQDLFKLNIPMLGICLGAQLIAYAAGGGIRPLFDSVKNKYTPELGWLPISFISNNLCPFNVFEEPFYVLHWHGDQILLPNSATLLASSMRCKEQMYKIGNKIYGLQFHLETINNDIFKWLEEDSEFVMKAYGDNFREILIQQELEHGTSSLQKRKQLIRILLDEISMSD
tara:strand:- start:1950 stop:2690 length:741 start_codon:yes stop_codon:yes gene_type:complete